MFPQGLEKKMIAQLKELSSYEIDEDLASYTPELHDNFELTILASIGVKGMEGADLFQFEICTPKSLSDRCEGGSGCGRARQAHCRALQLRGDSAVLGPDLLPVFRR